MTGFRADDSEILGVQSPVDNGSIELGIVDDGPNGKHFDLVAGGVTYVCVRLLRGGHSEDEQHRLWCCVSLPLNYVPAKGTSVVVAVPAGVGFTPGAAMIIGIRGAAPPNQFSDSRAKLDFGEDVDLVIKARSITFTDYEDRYLTIGPSFGIKAGDATATGFQIKDSKLAFYAAEDGDAKAMFQLAGAEGVKLVWKGAPATTGFTMKDGKYVGFGLKFTANYVTGQFGNAIAPAQGVGYGVGPASLMSATWFVQS